MSLETRIVELATALGADIKDLQAQITTDAAAAVAGKVDTTDPRLSDARAPTGAAGGVLSGTYPNPGFAADMATQAELDAAINLTTPRTSATGSAIVPAGTEAQRDGTPAAGYLRFNTTTTSFEGHNGSEWGAIGGASGGVSVTLSGNLTLYATQSTVLTITNFDSATTYGVSATGGTVSRTGAEITYTAGSVAGTYVLTITTDTGVREVDIEVLAATVVATVVAPTITSPTNGETGLGQAPAFTTAAFDTIGVADTHLNSDHEVRTGPNGTGTLIASSYTDAVNLTSWTMPGNLLTTATLYYYRTLHRGTTLGASGWSEVSFTTAATFGGLIGTQGGQGFGVGVYAAGSLPSGFSTLTGTTDPASANYGNYEYSDGSIMVFVPKFYYRIGNAASPRFATYGANAVDIAGIDTYADEAAANAAGYALHRAFKDGGAIKSGFFMDKYLCSKNAGNTAGRSVQNGVPISLATTAGYTVSNGMVTGEGTCTGILADAVLLARARGVGTFNVASVFMVAAEAMLSLAHAQAATSTTHCAWYDAGGTTNFPKGCNNNALADVNDTGVTFTTAGDSGNANKPLTGSGNPFAKTTHNGQSCGIADVNGAMWQVALGITQPGANATDTAQRTTGAQYQRAWTLKESVALSSLTHGWNASTDAWGNETHLNTLYDETADLFWWTASAATYYGNGANAVFSGATSGRDWLRTAIGISADSTGMSATGTAQFGNDYHFAYARANLFVLCAGSWNLAASAGVFYRFWVIGRSNGNSSFGFRASAYGS